MGQSILEAKSKHTDAASGNSGCLPTKEYAGRKKAPEKFQTRSTDVARASILAPWLDLYRLCWVPLVDFHVQLRARARVGACCEQLRPACMQQCSSNCSFETSMLSICLPAGVCRNSLAGTSLSAAAAMSPMSKKPGNPR